jgi:hypothetical protein
MCGMNSPGEIGHASRMAQLRRTLACALGLCLLIAQGAYAFEYPVLPDDVRQAYYLGQTSDRQKLANFYNSYIHRFPYPASHPLVYVESVEFQTPYEQIVSRSQILLNRQTPLEADEGYQKNPGLVWVKVLISYKESYGGAYPSLDGFNFTVSQRATIEPQKAPAASICDPAVGGACINYRLDVLLSFDAKQFRQEITKVKIETPDGKTFQTSFDLAHLK